MAIATSSDPVPVVPIPAEKLLELHYANHKRLLESPAIPSPTGELPEEDGVPLESDWHRLEMNLLIECVTYHFQQRDDYYVGGNMFIHFNKEQALNVDFRGPDFFFVRGARLNPPRRNWVVWKEDYKFPNVIIELTSPSTEKLDRTIKKDIYEKVFRTNDYFIVDPDDHRIQGWHLVGDFYVEITPDERGWFWCAELGMWLGNWQGKFQEKVNTYARFFDERGELVPLFSEAAEAERRIAEAERKRMEAERQRRGATSTRRCRTAARRRRAAARRRGAAARRC